MTALVIEQESLVNHSSGGSLAGSLVLLLLVIHILHKYILDVSNGIIYHDDSAVAYVVMQKKRLPLPQEEAHPG
jgi:hypothetical protein